jgi:hypothetical protein
VTSPAPASGSRRVGAIAAAASLLVAAGLVAWLVAASGDDRVAVSAIVTAAAAPVAAESTRQSLAQPIAASGPTGAPDRDFVEVCGVGWVEANADGTLVDPDRVTEDPAIVDAARAIVAELRASADEFERAIGLVLDDAADRGWPEQIAQEAITTADPRIYAFAYGACGAAQSEGNCSRLSAEQWARLDEGNALPWLFVLADAASRREREAVDEALYRIASSRRVEERGHDIAAPIVARAGTSDPQLMAATLLAVRAVGVAAALRAPDLGQLTAFACSPAALADNNRRQLCDGAAVTLAERSNTAMTAAIGSSLGRGVGWSLERVVAARLPLIALTDAVAGGRGAGAGTAAAANCDALRNDMASLGRVARLGETEVVRTWLAANEKLLESYARKAREFEEQRADREAGPRRAATAADGASAPA